MSDETVKLIAAVVAASAVVAAAFIGLVKDRKSRRDAILTDLEIADKIPNPALNHTVLMAYIERRVFVLALEDKLGLVVFSATTIVVILILLLLAGAVGFLTSHIWWSVAVATLLLIIAALLIGYRFATSWLLNRLYNLTTERVNATISAFVGDEQREKWRDDMIDVVLKQNPTMTREQLLQNYGAVIDQKLEEALKAATAHFSMGAFLKVNLDSPTEQPPPPNPGES
jgi:hypothetical protein